MVATALRSVFTQKCSASLEGHWDQVGAILAGKFSRAVALLVAARRACWLFGNFRPANGASHGAPTCWSA